MPTTRGGTALDCNFSSTVELQGANLNAEPPRTVSVNDGSTIQFYRISDTNDGEAVGLNNGKFANPVSPDKIWLPQSNNFTIIIGSKYLVDGSSNIVDAQMPATLSVGQEIIVHNESISTNKVQLVNPNFTIKGPLGTIPAGTDLELAKGDTVHLAAKTSLILEVV